MRNFILVLMTFCSVCILAPEPVFAESSEKLIQQAKKEYEAGNFKNALNLLIKDLEQNPDDGTTHYYMGLVRREMGQDLPALKELELAARLLPAETLNSYATQAIAEIEADERKLPEEPKQDWFKDISDSVTEFFGGKPKGKSSTSSKPTPWQMPDLMAGVDEAFRQTKRMIKGYTQNKKRKPGYYSLQAKTMSMADIQDLVRKSRVVNKDKWASHTDGLKSFRQSPKDSPGWDYWIARFKRSFQYILMSNLAKEGEVRPYGSAACIFSLDNRGNLRGHIYASTASDRLNRCLIKTIRELDHSRILKFPKSAKITGYNFQMSWQFGKLLRYIAYVKAVKAKRLKLIKEQEAKAEAEKLKLEKETKAKLLAKKKEAQRKARLKRIALAKKKREAQKQHVVKTEVEGLILPKPKPIELRAKQLTLKDVPFNEALDTASGDPFSKIDDKTIMNWPDVNR